MTTQEEEMSDFIGSLSWLEYYTHDEENEGRRTLRINSDPRWAVVLKKPETEYYNQSALEDLIYGYCAEKNIDYVTSENITKLVREIKYEVNENAIGHEYKDVDRSRIAESSVTDIIRRKKGLHKTRAKIVGVSEPYKLISKVTQSCPKCGWEDSEDFTKMPVMSYRRTKKYCPDCYSLKPRELSDLSDLYDHMDAMSIQLQEVDLRDTDPEKLHVILLEDHTRGVRIGDIAIIVGEVSVLNPTGAGGKKPIIIMYTRDIEYDREHDAPITEDDITVFRQFVEKHEANTPNELVRMFAPGVIGHNDAKLGILRSAVNVREARHTTGFRTRIHTDLAGDPGTAKSKLAKEATKIVPNAKWVTSQHTAIKSALAIFDKDPELGTMLMLGPVPQAKNSICGINEIGSLSFEDQQHLADVLEEGQFTKTAYGRNQEIDSPTTIIATTNPEGGYWDSSRTPSLDQVPIKSNIKDRFDQHYFFQDFKTDDECADFAAQKSEHYLNPESVEADYDFLKRYLQYAASLPVPKLTSESSAMLAFFWRRMRKTGYASNRNLDSLYRIAQAQARLHLKEEIDIEVVQEVMRDVQLMYVQLGKLVDPSVEDPRILAYNQIIQYVNTLSFPIEFTEALKHVYEQNDLVKQYLGKPTAKEWYASDNKKVRAILDKFTDGGTGQIKVASGGQAIAIHSLKPLTLVKAASQTVAEGGQQKIEQQEKIKTNLGEIGSYGSYRSDAGTVIEQSHSTDPPSDPNDLYDLDFDKKELQIEAIIQTLLKDQETFTEEDWRFKASMWPNLGWKITQAEQAFKLLLQKNKIVEVQAGRYRPVVDNGKGGGT
jgi:replicative DNA helicase Mcm